MMPCGDDKKDNHQSTFWWLATGIYTSDVKGCYYVRTIWDSVRVVDCRHVDYCRCIQSSLDDNVF